MKTITVLEYQNLVDVCVQEYGSIEGIVKLCSDNNLTIGQALTPGTTLLIDENLIFRQFGIEVLKNKLLSVQTDFQQEGQVQLGIFDYTFDYTFE